MFRLAFRAVGRYWARLPVHSFFIVLDLAAALFCMMYVAQFVQTLAREAQEAVINELATMIPYFIAIAVVFIYSLVNISALYKRLYSYDKKRFSLYKLCGASPAKLSFISAVSYILFIALSAALASAAFIWANSLMKHQRFVPPEQCLWTIIPFCIIMLIFVLFQVRSFRKSDVTNIEG